MTVRYFVVRQHMHAYACACTAATVKSVKTEQNIPKNEQQDLRKYWPELLPGKISKSTRFACSNESTSENGLNQ